VNRSQHVGDIADQRGDLDRGQHGQVVESIRQCIAFNELHRDPRPMVGQHAAVVDPDDPRMTNAIQDGSLLHDARGHPRLSSQLAMHDLQCSTTRQDGVPGFVYCGHSTPTYLPYDPIRTHQGVSTKFGEGLGGHVGVPLHEPSQEICYPRSS
jgi:hypothetical protein